MTTGATPPAAPDALDPGGWQRGRGWGWVWGDDDEVGALNALGPESVLRAVGAVRAGRVYDLGLTLDRRSFVWSGHAATEVVPFRTARGIKTMGDLIAPDPDSMSFQTSLVMLSDHAGTQIDALCHATSGRDDHWYNGATVADHGSDFGPVRSGAERIPPIVARGVLIDVARQRGVDHLPSSTAIGSDDLRATLDAQGTDVQPGDVVLVRTGSLGSWGELGHDHAALGSSDTAGITLEAARWLCEDVGAVLIGSDTSALEVVPPVDGDAASPVHQYLLVEQGVHMGELHYLEELSADTTFEFCYVALTPKLRGTTAGFALRPIAMV
jgi:kynurenine formamidase